MMLNIVIPTLMQIFLSSPAGNSEEAIHLFKVTYLSKSSTNSAKIEAIHGLSAVPSLGRAKILGQLLTKAPEEHQIAAAKALAKFRGVKGASKIVSNALKNTLNRNKSAVQVALIKTLGTPTPSEQFITSSTAKTYLYLKRQSTQPLSSKTEARYKS